VIVKQTPIMPYDVPEKAGFRIQRGLTLSVLGLPRSAVLVRVQDFDNFASTLAGKPNVVAYDPKLALCSGDFCRATGPGMAVFYFNPDHLSMTGVRFAFRDLGGQIYPGAE
jgi:hypothetical protein